MRILMIGGTALVGPHVIRELLAVPDTQIWTLTRSGKPYFCEVGLQGDRDDEASVIRAIEFARPDVIIDMIPFTATNAQTLVSATRKTMITPKLVAISSIDVYRVFGRLNGTEKAPFQPSPIVEDMALRSKLGPEGASYDKISVERMLREGFANAIILRLPATYGWPDTTRVEDYLDQMLDGVPVMKLPEERATFRFSRCLHKNAAFAVALAVRSPIMGHRTYNVAESTAFTELEWAQRIASFCGWSGKIEVTPWSEGSENPRQQFEIATQAIRQDLGFHEKYDVVEGLSDTVAFHAYKRLGKTYEKYY